MAFEVSKGRSCDSVRVAQVDEIKKKGKELIDTNKALDLKISENGTLSNLLTNSKKGNEILSSQFALDISKEKRKTKRWRRIGFIEAVLILGIILTTRI